MTYVINSKKISGKAKAGGPDEILSRGFRIRTDLDWEWKWKKGIV
jgi:hypothetical protein